MRLSVSRSLFAALLLGVSSAALAVPFSSQSALVIEEETGKILMEKNADKVSSIASLTKLMTAMVVLDAAHAAKLDMDERIVIQQADVDMLKHSSSRVPVGTSLPRREMMHLALMSSDNRAAASLARTYPGGKPAFLEAVKEKIAALGMTNTVIGEPTGLSPSNRSTAADLIKMAIAAGEYEDIARVTTDTADQFRINNRAVGFHNTNHFVGQKGWDILLSKTGYTMEAGRCLIMRLKAAGKNVVMVLLNASAPQGRSFDAVQIQRFLAGGSGAAPVMQASARGASPRATPLRSKRVRIQGRHHIQLAKVTRPQA